MIINLDTKIEQLNRVGKTVAHRLKKLGMETVSDLIYYFPFRYDDFSKVFLIKELQAGTVVTIKGTIELIANRRSPRRRTILTEAVIADDADSIKAIWFNQPFLVKMFKPGDSVYLSGRVDDDYGHLHFVNPVCEKVKETTLHTARVVPIYPLTQGITQKQLRFLIKQALVATPKIVDWLPSGIIGKLNLAELKWSLSQIHFPDDFKNLYNAADRLKFNELFLLQLKIQLAKKEFAKSRAYQINFNQAETKKFVDNLAFSLTNDQKKSAWQILLDLGKITPMNRLLEGDVGSGKTVVSAIAVFNVFLAGYQSVYMAPTEILAQQHYNNFLKLFSKYKIKVALVTHSESKLNGEKISKKEILEKIKTDKIDLIIGTHALIQDQIEFGKLALAVIDEQHRFGVKQRKALKEKADNKFMPHLLSMTATPIPRSLSLIFYGDLDLSIIKELPVGRKKIITEIITPQQRPKIYNFIKNEVKNGRQVFVICPLIDPSDILGVKSVTEEYKRLKSEVFIDLPVDFLHGKMKAKEKDEKMKKFLAKKIQIMVATSVIEVGVDVPNATVMMIEGAERFGLAQLYQFRGRVGRSDQQSYCFLFTENPSGLTRQRLQAIITAKDCFELAEIDLKLRGPGEIFGTQQSGFSDLKVATLQDYRIAGQAKDEVKELLESNSLEKYPLLINKIKTELELAHFE